MSDDGEAGPTGSDRDGATPTGSGERAGEAGRSLRRRVTEQFSDAGDRAAIWRGFDRILPTRSYLNMGYSPWYLPHAVGSNQRRLADHLADGLVGHLGDPTGVALLDLGCGRGGPARRFAARGFGVTGLDLVPYNVALARESARARDDGAGSEFLVGDATALPFADGVFGACAAVDSLVYLPETGVAFGEVARVLADDGWFVTADLLAADGVDPAAGGALDAFADAWDMAPIERAGTDRERLRGAGFTVERVEDVTANSTGRLRTWSGLFLALVEGPAGGAVRSLLRRWDADPDAVVERVRAAHRALPHLRHEIVYARA